MTNQDSHLSDQQLLLDMDGELSSQEDKLVRAHLSGCWKCRTRRQDLERAMAEFVRLQQQDLPPVDGPRALLKAHLSQTPSAAARKSLLPRRFTWLLAASACCLVAMGLFINRAPRPGVILSVPNSKLTPGATLLLSRRQVCGQNSTNNKAVPVALQRKVFEEYGIDGAEPRAYEVDYLITPALGGADDIHNLWPHSYSATMWNAQVKDALEKRMRDMVCDGELDLTQAQLEISENWIAAYKKYFRTDAPLPEHRKQSIQ